MLPFALAINSLLPLFVIPWGVVSSVILALLVSGRGLTFVSSRQSIRLPSSASDHPTSRSVKPGIGLTGGLEAAVTLKHLEMAVVVPAPLPLLPEGLGRMGTVVVAAAGAPLAQFALGEEGRGSGVRTLLSEDPAAASNARLRRFALAVAVGDAAGCQVVGSGGCFY